jgi:hypothetical protein
MELNGFGSKFLPLIFASYAGLIIFCVLVFCISIIVLIIKWKVLNKLKIIFMIFVFLSAFFIGVTIYLSIGMITSVAIIGGSDGPTAVYLHEQSDNEIDFLQFNGVYYCEEADYTNYFRFFQNGKVIGLTSIGKYNEKILKYWTYEEYDDLRGEYVIENNSIEFSIDVVSMNGENGLVEYIGIINNDTMILNSYSKLNGNIETNKTYLFKEIEN